MFWRNVLLIINIQQRCTLLLALARWKMGSGKYEAELGWVPYHVPYEVINVSYVFLESTPVMQPTTSYHPLVHLFRHHILFVTYGSHSIDTVSVKGDM